MTVSGQGGLSKASPLGEFPLGADATEMIMGKEKCKEHQRGFHRGEEEPQGTGGKRRPVLAERKYQQERGNRNEKGEEEWREEAAEEKSLRTGKELGHTFPLCISNTKMPLWALAHLKCKASSCAPQQRRKGSLKTFLLLAAALLLHGKFRLFCKYMTQLVSPATGFARPQCQETSSYYTTALMPWYPTQYKKTSISCDKEISYSSDSISQGTRQQK